MEWQPIESAPKDGTSILLLYGGGGMEVGHYEKKQTIVNGVIIYSNEYWTGMLQLKINPPTPTHWVPLPELPKKPKYEWRAVSEWIAENAPSQGESMPSPEADGWEMVGGALRRPIP